MTTKIGEIYRYETGDELAGRPDDNENVTAWLQTEEGRVKVVSKRISHSVCCWKREEEK
jgi:hypothetical protein